MFNISFGFIFVTPSMHTKIHSGIVMVTLIRITIFRQNYSILHSLPGSLFLITLFCPFSVFLFSWMCFLGRVLTVNFVEGSRIKGDHL